MPKKQKLPAEEIIAIVRQCLKGEIGRMEDDRQVGVGETTITRECFRVTTVSISASLPSRLRIYNSSGPTGSHFQS